jgi:hypothetical protein
LDGYSEFLGWYGVEYPGLNLTAAEEDLMYFRGKQEAMLGLKSRCFEYLWRHMGIFFLGRKF